ncbi:MAG: class I SAM-dependent methyltransferase [Anaerolineae bacterium]
MSPTSVSQWNDPAYLASRQYKTDRNLAARQLIHRRFSSARVNWPAWLYALAGVQPGQSVLDVGCGNGRIWADNLSPRHPARLSVTLLDLSGGMLRAAATAVSGRVVRWQGVQASAMQLPVASARFNVAFANHMLYHVPQPARAIAEFRRVLLPGGTLVAALNGETHMQELWQLVLALIGGNAGFRSRHFLPGHAAPLLEQHFKRVTRHHFENDLRVTDAGLLWQYVLSMNPAAAANIPPKTAQSLEAEFKRRVNHDINANGHFHITTSAMAFVCRK